MFVYCIVLYQCTQTCSLSCGSDSSIYEACPESNDTKVLNMYNIFNLQK